jgi:hypothetical protein
MNYIILIICSIILPIYSLQAIKAKLCINCKYFIPDNYNSKFGRCSLFPKKENKINFLVNGIDDEEYYLCCIARDTNNMCGKEGKYYKKKTVKIGILNGKKI